MTDDDRVREGNEVIQDETIRLDFGQFNRKSFIRCRLVFSGGLPPLFGDCDFIESGFTMEGPALNTALFLKILATSGEEAESMVLTMLGLKK